MANEVQVGTGILFGITSGGTKLSIAGVAGILDSAKIAQKFNLERVEDELGFTAALIATDAHFEFDVVWTATGTTRADAANGAVFLLPLATVALADFGVALFNGNWLYVGDQSIDLSHKAAKLMLKLRRWADPDQNAALTAGVING